MRVLFLTANTSRKAGGLFFTITNYTQAIKQLGIDVEVCGIDDEYSEEDRYAYGEVRVRNYKPLNLPYLSTLGYSLDLITKIEDFNPDIIHVQGLWMYHSLAALKYRKKHKNVIIVIEPHGMLDPWALKNSTLKKKIVGHWFEYENLRTADCLHALCESERESIRKFGLKNKTVVIPNGITIPKERIERNKKEKTILFIGRIHPKKGIRQLIEGIHLIAKTNKTQILEWQFRIAGWDQNGHQKELEDLVNKYSLEKIVKFLGPVFGARKEEELKNASAFILPSFSEGLPMSILEAWSYGVPTIMTSHCNLPIGFESGASINIETTPESISKGILQFMSLEKNEIKIMSDNAINLAKEKFTWSSIAEDTVKLYNNLLSNR